MPMNNPSSVSGAALTQVAHAAAIALTGSTYSPDYPLVAAITYTLSGTPVGGAQHRIGLIADGVTGHVPTWAGIGTDPVGDTFNNSAGRLHSLFVYNDGVRNWALLRDLGLTVSASPATGITLTGTAGTAGTAVTFTVAANGTLSSSVTVTPTAVAGVTFSPASVTLTSGSTSATFTATAASAGTYSIAVTNSGGLSNLNTISLVAGAAATSPTAPTGPTLGTATSTTQPLTWTAPSSNGGSAITDYVIQYAPAGSGSWVTFADGPGTATATTVTGLSAATAYDYRVAAVNAIGISSYSSTATGATAAGSSATIVQFATLGAHLTQTGNGTTGWIYTATTGASLADVTVGASVSMAADFDIRFKAVNRPSAKTLVFGLDASNATTAYTDFDSAIYAAGLYSPSSGANYVNLVTGGGGTDTGVAATSGDIVRAVRTGTTVVWSVSKDNESTWTTICTHTSISGTKYPALSVAEVGVSVGPVRLL